MARIRIPQYPEKPHPSGQARIKFQGRQVYLGKHGSPESIRRYADLLRQIHVEPSSSVTVMELVAAHLQWAKVRYQKNGKPTSEVGNYRTAVKPLLKRYGEEQVVDFGPRKLIQCRQDLIAQGICRTSVNRHVGRIRRVFKWGIPRELVPAAVLVGLQSVVGLREGEDGARETEPVKPVPEEHIEAVKPYVSTPVWGMIRMQLLTGMRPGEVIIMRAEDIVKGTHGCWVYIPESHKTEHHGRSRTILLGPEAMELIAGRSGGYIFSPAQGRAEYVRSVQEGARYHRRGKRKANPKRAPGKRYSEHSYISAVRRGCLKAQVPHWSPGRLRHNAATWFRQKGGAELAQIILGHADLKTTEIYAERDLTAAARVVSRWG